MRRRIAGDWENENCLGVERFKVLDEMKKWEREWRETVK